MSLLKKIERFLFVPILIGTLAVNVLGVGLGIVFAGDIQAGEIPPPEVEVVNPYFTLEHNILEDGTAVDKAIINGPSEPPTEYEQERLASIQPLPSDGILPTFPSYSWVFGCSAVSGAMIAAFYDNNDYPNMYTGATNGGVMPQTEDPSWSTWTDGFVTYPNNPLIASHDGLDGRTTYGSIDDYWVKYGSTANDPFIGNWTEHTWSDAIGDYMKTSQSLHNNTDGSTSFYNWNASYPDPDEPLTCSQMEGFGIDDEDGTYGRKLFYEARGYTVSDCYNQNTDNEFSGGFSLADFQAEIDAGHPVLLNLEGHSIVGYGYSGDQIYIRDTWSSDPSFTPTMTWGTSYGGMDLYSVSVVHLDPVSVPPDPPTGVSASDGTYTDRVRISWTASDGADDYKVYRNTINSTSGAAELTSSHPASPYDDFSVTPEATYYYWVKACNGAGCSGFSSSDSGYAASVVTIPSPPTGVSASDGTYTDKVRISWTAADGATYYKIFRNTSATHAGETELSSSYPASPYDDATATPEVTYTYWVKACNSEGCSDYSSYNTGWRAAEVGESYIFLPLVLNGFGSPSAALINGDFEQGHVGWTEEASGGFDLIWGDVAWAHSGSWIAYLGGYHNAVD